MYGVAGNVLISSQIYPGLNFHPLPAVSTLSLSDVGAPENSLCGQPSFAGAVTAGFSRTSNASSCVAETAVSVSVPAVTVGAAHNDDVGMLSVCVIIIAFHTSLTGSVLYNVKLFIPGRFTYISDVIELGICTGINNPSSYHGDGKGNHVGCFGAFPTNTCLPSYATAFKPTCPEVTPNR